MYDYTNRYNDRFLRYQDLKGSEPEEKFKGFSDEIIRHISQEMDAIDNEEHTRREYFQ